jgi:hypothetical protein
VRRVKPVYLVPRDSPGPEVIGERWVRWVHPDRRVKKVILAHKDLRGPKARRGTPDPEGPRDRR